MRPQFEPTLALLRDLDFRPLRLLASLVAGLSAEFDKLLPEIKEADAEKTAFGAIVARLEELRPRAAGDEVNLEAEDEYLKGLDELEKLLWQVRMKWVFSD